MKRIIALLLTSVMILGIVETCHAGSILDSLDTLESYGNLIGSFQNGSLSDIMDAFGIITDQMDANDTSGELEGVGDSFRTFGDMFDAIEHGDIMGILRAYNDLAGTENGTAGNLNDQNTGLSALSSEELLELADAVQKEMEARGMLKDYIGAGTYSVGTDIREGRFRFTCLQQYQGAYVIITVLSGNTLVDSFSVNIRGTVDLDLKNGYTLIISNGTGTLTEAAPSWAP